MYSFEQEPPPRYQSPMMRLGTTFENLTPKQQIMIGLLLLGPMTIIIVMRWRSMGVI